MKYFPKLAKIKRGKYNLYIIVGLLFVIVGVLFYSWYFMPYREGFGSSEEISLNITLTDTTKAKTDPNPIGNYIVYTSIKGRESDKIDLSIPYPTNNGNTSSPFSFDSSSTTILKIEPKMDSSNNDRHRANMFPLKCKIDIKMDNVGPVYEFSQQSVSATGETNTTKTTNTISKSDDLFGNEITIVKNGDILDLAGAKIGSAFRGDSNPLNPSSKDQYTFNIILNKLDDISLSRINIEYAIPPLTKKPPPDNSGDLTKKAADASNNSAPASK
jgi:hypothetical protein